MAQDNQVVIVGNLTRDPELRYTPNGAALVKFGVAVSRRVKDDVTGQWKETAEGEKRSVVEIEAEEIGPSLKWATAKIEKTGRGMGQSDWSSNVAVGVGGSKEESPLDA